MKKIVILLLTGALPMSAWAHGTGHLHRSSDPEISSGGEPPESGTVGSGHDHAGHDHAGHSHSVSGKSFKESVIENTQKNWGASLTTGWESRHVHYGVDETGTYGAYTTEVALSVGNFLFSAWSGFGTGNGFQEWDFTAAYNLELGPVFLIPGYNFRYSPGLVAHSDHDDHEGHDDHHEEEPGHDDHDDQEGHDHGDHSGHSHQTYGNELFLVLGTTAIPYVTPNVAFIWDLNNTPGAFLEFRLDGEIPLVKNLWLEPYALLGLNFGYNTREYYGWNNFQFGLQANWQINRVITVFAGVNYNVAMTALQTIDQGNVVWANVGVTFAY